MESKVLLSHPMSHFWNSEHSFTTCWLCEWQRLETGILILSITERCLVQLGQNFFQVRAFRIVRILQILSKFRYFTGIRNAITTLTKDSFQLAMVFFVLVFFLLGICTLLLALLSSSFSRRCVKVERNFGACASDSSTGWSIPKTCDLKRWRQTFPERKRKGEGGAGPDTDRDDLAFPIVIDDFYPFERWCQIGLDSTPGAYDDAQGWDRDIKGHFHTCGKGRSNYKKGSEMCVTVGNPNYGFSHFDNLGG